VHLRRLAILGLTLISSCLVGSALAGGRASVRVEYPLFFSAQVEQIVYTVNFVTEEGDSPGPLGVHGAEAVVGADLRLVDETLFGTPYAGLAFYWQMEWLRFEFALPYDFGVGKTDFRFGLAAGVRWD
jgi:hypothetical protein